MYFENQLILKNFTLLLYFLNIVIGKELGFKKNDFWVLFLEATQTTEIIISELYFIISAERFGFQDTLLLCILPNILISWLQFMFALWQSNVRE